MPSAPFCSRCATALPRAPATPVLTASVPPCCTAQVHRPVGQLGGPGRAQLGRAAQADRRLAHQHLPLRCVARHSVPFDEASKPANSVSCAFAAVGARITGVDDTTYSITGEAFSQVVAANSATHTSRLLQEDDVSLGAISQSALSLSCVSPPCSPARVSRVRSLRVCEEVPGLHLRQLERESAFAFKPTHLHCCTLTATLVASQRAFTRHVLR